MADGKKSSSKRLEDARREVARLKSGIYTPGQVAHAAAVIEAFLSHMDKGGELPDDWR